jgi:DNA processing protein
MTDARYWLGFNLIPGIGPARVRRLLAHFGDPKEAWHAGTPGLLAAGLDPRAVDLIVSKRAQLDLDRELARVERAAVTLVTVEDALYPPLLRHVADGPPL